MRISRLAWLLMAAGCAALALLVYSQTQAKPEPHSITLRWSPSPDATSYNVYRGTASGGPYSKLGSATAPLYVDHAVSGGTVYYYVITADYSGRESPFSKEIRAAVP